MTKSEEFEYARSLLPNEMYWGEPITVAAVLHIAEAARRTVSGQEARNTILHEVAAIVEGLPGDYRPWDCAQAITDMTRDAAPIPATELSDELLVELFYAAQGDITRFRIKAREILAPAKEA